MVYSGDMTEMLRAPEGVSSKPRIKPANAGDGRPVSISARLGRLQFHHSGKFRVLQLADIQDGPKVSKDTIRLIEASLDATRPDLVILTGNQIAGYDAAFAPTFRKRRWAVEGESDPNPAPNESALRKTRELVRQAAAAFTEPMVKRGIPWAVTYGNHDFQCGLDNVDMDEIYRSLPGCVNPAVDSAGPTSMAPGGTGRAETTERAGSMLPDQAAYACEPGTFALPVEDAERTRVVLGLMLVDSGDYAPGGGFGTPSGKALEFLRTVPQRMGSAKSMVFQHMPLPEYYRLLKPVKSSAAFAMQGYRQHADTYYVLDESATQIGGYLGEGISCPDQSGEFAILRQTDGYFGVVAGHDHRNGFAGELDGILLIATPTCGFNSYGPAPAKRATRLIEFDIRHPYEPRTQLLEFGELVGKPSSKKVYTYAVNQATPGEGEGDDLLRKPSLWARLKAMFG